MATTTASAACDGHLCFENFFHLHINIYILIYQYELPVMHISIHTNYNYIYHSSQSCMNHPRLEALLEGRDWSLLDQRKNDTSLGVFIGHHLSNIYSIIIPLRLPDTSTTLTNGIVDVLFFQIWRAPYTAKSSRTYGCCCFDLSLYIAYLLVQ